MKTIKRNPSFYFLDFPFLTLCMILWGTFIFLIVVLARDLSRSIFFLSPKIVSSQKLDQEEGYFIFGKIGSDRKFTTQTLEIINESIIGNEVPLYKSKKPSVAFSVDNSIHSIEPRSFHFGLNDASINFEILSEGGKTQILSVFQENSPFEVMPISQSKTHHVDLVNLLNSYFVFNSSTDESLDKIRELNVDYLTLPGQDFSLSLSTRPEIANNLVYTDQARNELMSKFGYKPPISWFKFKDEEIDIDKIINRKFVEVSIPFSSDFNYKVKYLYDPLTNSYFREMGSEIPFLDYLDGSQVSTKNIIVLQADFKILSNPEREINFDFSNISKVWYFVDGEVEDSGSVEYSQETGFKFLDERGEEVEFNRGNFWIEVIPPGINVTYSK